MIKTKLTEMFGVEHPIIQGGLMWVATAELTSAVANAGAMGFMTALTQPDAEALRAEIRKCRDMTDKPFGINLTILPSLRQPDYPAYIRVCIEEDIKFIETAGRNPEPFMEPLKAAGIKVIHKCTSVRHCVKAEKIGCDAVSVDGFECAGHPGEDDIPALILLPATADQISIPMIASGGFGDGRGLVAALALGADGINMGTRCMCTKEAPVHVNVKQEMIKNDERATDLIFRTMRNTARVARNAISQEVVEIEKKGNATIDDISHLVAGTRGKVVLEDGDMDHGIWSAGMVQGIIHDIPSCEELVLRIVREAEEIIEKRLNPCRVMSEA